MVRSDTDGGVGDSDASSPSCRTPSPEEQVVELVNKYGDVNSLSTVLHEPLKKPEQISLFFEVLERHVSLIKSRSQAFEDGHVTVYDKALLALTQNGTDLHNMGALELYLDEVVGIGYGDSVEKMEKVLEKHIRVNALFGQRSSSESNKHDNKRDNKLLPLANGNSRANIQRTRQPKNLPVSEDKLSHILAVYAKAKADYYAIDDSSVEDKTRAAKFLRDTAENTLVYIKAQKPDHRLIPELESTREMAKDKAITLCGGRKRRFEICEMNNVHGIPKHPRHSSPGQHYQGGGEYHGGRSREPHRSGSSYVGGGRRRADCYRPY
ncbi:hypothetical protein FQN54_003282 [Arachnomyces sp. PD_36]|nr:hypothetical protein FQN54_003282 [Arachnomyces sp. PD_36]